MLSNITVTPFKRTNALGTQTGLRVSWDSDSSEESVSVSYNRSRTGFVFAPITIERQLELVPAEPGEYVFSVLSQVPLSVAFSYDDIEYSFDGLPPAESDLTRPSGLELVGPNGELLGSAREFTGRDLRLRWNSLRADALQTAGLGEQAADQLIERTVVQVFRNDTDELIRRESMPVDVAEWVYSYAHATEDIPLTADPDSVLRDLRFEVVFRDSTGRESTPALINVEWTLRLTATADIDVAGTKEFSSFTKSSAFTLLQTHNATETYGPATMSVFDENSVVRALIRINFDLLAVFEFHDPPYAENKVLFEVLRRPVAGADSVLDSFRYDMHVTYPTVGNRARISIPSFAVNDTPGEGTFEYRVRVTLTIVAGGTSIPITPTLQFQGSLLNLEAEQSKR